MNKAKFNFISQIENNSTLMVGEGNMSFALNLALSLKCKRRFLVSVCEEQEHLSKAAMYNALKLEMLKVKVLFDINAKNLDLFKDHVFGLIIFQFPNSGSRIPLWERNPNFILIKQFLRQAKQKISNQGRAVITTVDNSYYDKIFEFEKNALDAGFSKMSKFIFDPNDFPLYKHTMAHQNQNGIEKYDRFVTRVFS